MVWEVIGILFFFLIIGLVIFFVASEKKSSEKYDQFFENVEHIVKFSESISHKLSKNDVITYMEPYHPYELSDSKKRLVEMFGDDYLVYRAFNVTTSRSGWTMTTASHTIYIVFYFVSNELVGIKNLTPLLKD